MQSEFNKGAAYARDCIIADIIGLQNKIIDQTDGEQYKTLQSLLIKIEDSYGEIMKDFGG
ncbi:hypothetical protein [Kineothrix sedimenti]|uniref:Uncharacterized protein n=1 Tax=Kineothrix sedimenti TaxID=3123317 RepID=A0ABZ3F040_9FIRM